MRLRSTGLGKTELVGYLESVKRREGYLILSVRTTEPVSWRIRVALTPKDVRKVTNLSLRPSTLSYLLSCVLTAGEPGPLPDF